MDQNTFNPENRKRFLEEVARRGLRYCQLDVSIGMPFAVRLRATTRRGSVVMIEAKDFEAALAEIPFADPEDDDDDDIDTPLVAGEVAPAYTNAGTGEVTFTLPTIPGVHVKVVDNPPPQPMSAVIAACSEQVKQAYEQGKYPGYAPLAPLDPQAATVIEQGVEARKLLREMEEAAQNGSETVSMLLKAMGEPLTESTSATGKGDVIEAIARPAKIDEATRALARKIAEDAKSGCCLPLPIAKPSAHAIRKITLKVPDGKPLESVSCLPVSGADGKVIYSEYIITLPPGTEVDFED